MCPLRPRPSNAATRTVPRSGIGAVTAGLFAVGSLPHDMMLKSIELLGTEVAPAVNAELARRVAA